MITWRAAGCADVIAPATATGLLERALESDPGNIVLQTKLADIALDRYDFAGAAAWLERALSDEGDSAGVRIRLARCYNQLKAPQNALAILEPERGPQFERALAWLQLGADAQAERELRAMLAADPHHRLACRHLAKLLRRSGRVRELLTLCEDLHDRGADHGQLFYSWGTALALARDDQRARSLLFDPHRVAIADLDPPAGFATIHAFNAALAEEILANLYRLSDFPSQDEANRGSSRVHALFAGARPELLSALIEAIQQHVELYATAARTSFDPWLETGPVVARIDAWGLIQSGGDYEEWHLHRAGWLSGVYYVRVPGCTSDEGGGPGCIEFGPPRALERARPGFIPVQRYQPREGMLLLAPSHYPHRTIPTGADEYRISLAFDVVPAA